MKQFIKVTILGLVVVLATVGCGQAQNDEVTGSMPVNSAPADNANGEVGIVAGKLVPVINYTQKEDGTVEFNFEVVNQTEEEQALEFTSSQKYDFIIKNEAGEKVFQSSDEKMYAQMMETATIKQGEKLDLQEEVQDLAAGKYTIEFWVTAVDKELKHTIEFEVK